MGATGSLVIHLLDATFGEICPSPLLDARLYRRLCERDAASQAHLSQVYLVPYIGFCESSSLSQICVSQFLPIEATSICLIMTTNGQPNNAGMMEAKLGHHKSLGNMSADEHLTAQRAARFGYGPLAHMPTNESARLPAFGGEFQPGLYKGIENRKFANPAPLGLCAFALTTFVLSLINLGARDIPGPNVVVAIAFGYGGHVQLLARIW